MQVGGGGGGGGFVGWRVGLGEGLTGKKGLGLIV